MTEEEWQEEMELSNAKVAEAIEDDWEAGKEAFWFVVGYIVFSISSMVIVIIWG